MSTESIRLTSELLNERNYPSWSKSVMFALSGRGKLGYINGKKTKPETSNPPKPEELKAVEEWEMMDHSVISWILASIEPKLAKMFLYSKSAHDLWQKIEGMYGQRNNFSYINQLTQEISQIRKGSRSHTEYLVELMAKYDELEDYLPPTTDLKEIEKHREHNKVYTYLGGLDSSFEAVRSQILLSQELPSFSAVVALVQREEGRRTAMNPQH